ncbi:MAG TPA: hypothetical protein VNV42_02485 [Solirubrobacteraceae bacterium]|jgi:hypothetical protein|nr:hypothetical protein [Solirubrobacteraceae bacterium]
MAESTPRRRASIAGRLLARAQRLDRRGGSRLAASVLERRRAIPAAALPRLLPVRGDGERRVAASVGAARAPLARAAEETPGARPDGMSEFAARWLFGDGPAEGIPFAGGAAVPAEAVSGPPAFLAGRSPTDRGATAGSAAAARAARSASRTPAPRGRVHEERPLRLSSTPPLARAADAEPASPPTTEIPTATPAPASVARSPSQTSPASDGAQASESRPAPAATPSAPVETPPPSPAEASAPSPVPAPVAVRPVPRAPSPAPAAARAPVALRRVARPPLAERAAADATGPIAARAPRTLLGRIADRLLGDRRSAGRAERSGEPAEGTPDSRVSEHHLGPPPAGAGRAVASALARTPASAPSPAPPRAGTDEGDVGGRSAPESAESRASSRDSVSSRPAEAPEGASSRFAPDDAEWASAPGEGGGTPAPTPSSGASAAPGASQPDLEDPPSAFEGRDDASIEAVSPGAAAVPPPGASTARGVESGTPVVGDRAQVTPSAEPSGLRRALARLRTGRDLQPAPSKGGASQPTGRQGPVVRPSAETAVVAPTTIHRAPAGSAPSRVPAAPHVAPLDFMAPNPGGWTSQSSLAPIALGGPETPTPTVSAAAPVVARASSARPSVRLQRSAARASSSRFAQAASPTAALRGGPSDLPPVGSQPRPGASTSGARLADATGAALHRDATGGVETIEFPVGSAGGSAPGPLGSEGVLARAAAGGPSPAGAPGEAPSPATAPAPGAAAQPGGSPEGEGGGASSGGASASHAGASPQADDLYEHVIERLRRDLLSERERMGDLLGDLP